MVLFSIGWNYCTVTVVYNCFFAESRRAKMHQSDSFCVQFEKIGSGLLREAFRRERECFVSQKIRGKLFSLSNCHFFGYFLFYRLLGDGPKNCFQAL